MKRGTGWMRAVVLMCVGTGAYAATPSWTNTVGGSFQTAGNWNPSTVPGGLDTAEFKQSAASPYTVTLDDHVSVTNVTFPSGVYAMTLDLNGYTLNSAVNGDVGVCSSSSAGHAIDLKIKSSQAGGVFNLDKLTAFNTQFQSAGSVTITGSNTLVNATLGIGGDVGWSRNASNSTFTVSDGARLVVNGTPLVGLGSLSGVVRNPTVSVSPFATVLFTDPGTVFSNILKGIIVGKAGTNMPTLVVSNGAYCSIKGGVSIGTGGDTWYSYSPKSNGKLVVTGANSTFDALAGFTMATLAGEYGTPGSTAGGYVVVEKGGKLNVTGGYTGSIGLNHYYPTTQVNPGSETNLNAYGELVVRDPGSSFRLTGSVTVTTVAKGAVYVLNGASLISGSSSALFVSGGTVPLSTTVIGGVTVTNQPAFTNDNAYGLFVVSNANSVATFNGVQISYQAGYGDVVVADNGQLSATNSAGGYIYIRDRSRLTVSDAFAQTYNLQCYSNATARIVLGARDHASAYIKTGNVTLNAFSKLEVGVLPTATLAAGDTVTLLQYTGTRTGTFKDLPEGATFYADGRRFKIAYGGGSNSAITLTYMPPGTMIGVL